MFGSIRSLRYPLILSVALHAIVLFAVFKLLSAQSRLNGRDVLYVYLQPAPASAPSLANHAASLEPSPILPKAAPPSRPHLYRLKKLLRSLKPIAPQFPPAPPLVPTTGGIASPASETPGSSVAVSRANPADSNSSGGAGGGIPGSHGDEPVPADQVPYPPVPITRVLPVYPIAARYREIQGRVVLQAIIDRSGQVEDSIKVVDSVPMFDDAAIAALRQWRFTPGRDREGHPVRVLIEVPLRFALR